MFLQKFLYIIYKTQITARLLRLIIYEPHVNINLVALVCMAEREQQTHFAHLPYPLNGKVRRRSLPLIPPPQKLP